MRLALLTVFVCTSVISTASRATGQSDGRWLIVPSTSSDDTSWIEQTAPPVRAELLAQGADVWALDRASERVESEESAPPAVLTESDIQGWTALSDGAIHDLARGNHEEALAKLNQAAKLSRSAIEILNRKPSRAQVVLDTCLYRVRAVLHTESKSRARSLARECRLMVPHGEPSPYMHPPSVTALLREVDETRSKQSGALRVESTPSGCAARLNGVMLGETPVAITEVLPGEYRVQVECDPEEHGRVHVVRVGAGRTELRVDSRWDHSVVTRPTLQLRYTSTANEAERRVADAQRLAKVVPARRVVLMSSPALGMVELELIDAVAGATGATGLARIRTGARGASNQDITAAVRTLLERRCIDFTSGDPATLTCRGADAADVPGDAEPWPEGRRPRGQFIFGLTLFGAGAASLITGYVLLVPRASAARDWANEVDTGGQDPSSQEKWLDLGTVSAATGIAGGALLVTAMPLALPERDKTPWWAWLSGGVGLGLAGFSIGYGVTAVAEPAGGCSTFNVDANGVRACVTRGERFMPAILTGMTAAPLITMPLVYLFRPSKAKLEPQVEVGRSGGYFGLRGRF